LYLISVRAHRKLQLWGRQPQKLPGWLGRTGDFLSRCPP
jgi:hypothetical protein